MNTDTQEFNIENVFSETKKFSTVNFEDKTEEYVEVRNKNILRLEIDDIKRRIISRNRYGIALIILLYIQNIFVFSLVAVALGLNRLQELQLIFATLTAATLGETVFTVNIIIKWLFKDINYNIKKNKHLTSQA
jgi:hypothetical protein